MEMWKMMGDDDWEGDDGDDSDKDSDDED